MISERVKLIEAITTWQGEGADTGRRMLLLRFKRCDRVDHKKPCGFCDTLIKMRISPESEFKVIDLQSIIDSEKCGLMITGGEPTWDPHFEECVYLLNNLKYEDANVETNGYNLEGLLKEVKSEQFNKIKFVFSPKMFNYEEAMKDIDLAKRMKDISNVVFKLVCTKTENLQRYIQLFLDELSEFNLNRRIYLMPEGRNREEILMNAPVMFDYAERWKVNVSTRMHIMYDFV